MDPESKKLLEDTFELEKENNQMLHKIRRVQKWAAFWSYLKILLFIGIAFGSFYFLEPYFNQVFALYDSISGVQQTPQNGEDSVFKNLLNRFGN